jgi:hypothetical protein
VIKHHYILVKEGVVVVVIVWTTPSLTSI